jgi:hypothetical protein
VLRGNEAAGRLLDSFAPLKAARALGVVEKAKLKEYGLEPPEAEKPAVAATEASVAKDGKDAAKDGKDAKPLGSPPKDGEAAGPQSGAKKPAEAKKPEPKKLRRLEVNARGEMHAFTVGTSPMSFSPYLRDERDGRVYLLLGSMVSDLESAQTRMIDRTLHALKPGEWDAFTVEQGGKKREFVLLTPENPINSKVAAAASRDKPDDTAKNWQDKASRVAVVDPLGRGEAPKTGEPTIALRIDYSEKGRPVGFMELARGPSEKSAVQDVYARTEHTAGWVKLSPTADDLVRDAEKLLQ